MTLEHGRIPDSAATFSAKDLAEPQPPLPGLVVIKHADLNEIFVDDATVAAVESAMTPDSILNQTEFPQPHIITPEVYPTFEDILDYKEEIRHLEPLPIKSKEQYDYYHAQPKELMTALIEYYLYNTSIALAVNRYPYWLPEDVRQDIIWIRDFTTPKKDIATFIAKLLQNYNKRPDEAIIFERPSGISTKLVRGTVPDYRHVHLWTKK